MLILLLALIALPSPSLAKSKLPSAPASAATKPASAKKSQLLEQLHTTCVKNSFQEGKSQEAVCDCLKANYGKKLNEEDLELLGRIQNGSVTKAELEGKDELLEFDMEASQGCVEDATWRWVPVAKAKEEAGEPGMEKAETVKPEAAEVTPAAKPAKSPKAKLKKKAP